MNAPQHPSISEAAVLGAFADAMRAAGLTPPELIEADGAIHRFSSSGKRGDEAGRYCLHLDGVPAGWFQCWRTMSQAQRWSAKTSTEMTTAEQAAHRQRVDAMQVARKADQEQRQRQAREEAEQRWDAAAPATAHAYPKRKGVQAHGARVEGFYTLLIPMRDAEGTLHSLQTITPDGGKRFLAGGRVTGCFHLIGHYQDVGELVICEGFATGASIHESTGYPVAVAFNAGNLEAVALALRAKYPQARLIVAADDDHSTKGNPGMTKATAAAKTVGGLLAVPKFPADRPEKATDFNDLHQLAGGDAGLEAVRECFTAVRQAESIPVVTSMGGAVPSDAGPVWGDPIPLPDALPPVAPFDAELLPKGMRGWVSDTAYRMQCPQDFVAVAAVVAASSLIGARAVVQPKERDNWQVVPNLWGAAVGRAGVMKSPAIGEALKPLYRLEARERELWQAAHEAWIIDCQVAELAADTNRAQAKKLAAKDPAAARALLAPVDTFTEPQARRYVLNDATVEKLAELLEANPWGTLVFRDEIHGLLCSMDRQGQEGARAFYLQGYDGNGSYTTDRIGRGTQRTSRVCLAMMGGIQPGKVQSYVREAVAGGTGDDGLLQRFGLLVWPDIEREFKRVDQCPDADDRQRANEIFERLNKLQPDAEGAPVVWRFTPEAQEIFWEWYLPHQTELRSNDELHPALVSHLSKYSKLVPALALIFALIDTPDSGQTIGATEILRALAWAEYLRTHAERLYSAATTPETTGAELLLSKIRAGKLAEGGKLLHTFTPRQVAVKHWAGLGTPEAVRKAADLLADYDWLKKEVAVAGARGGRPSDRYMIHPDILARVMT